MAKPQQHHNGPDMSEGPGDRVAEEGGEGASVQAKEEGREWTQGETNMRRATRPLEAENRWRRRKRRDTKRKGKGTERPHGGNGLRLLVWGGMCPPQRKTQTY